MSQGFNNFLKKANKSNAPIVLSFLVLYQAFVPETFAGDSERRSQYRKVWSQSQGMDIFSQVVDRGRSPLSRPALVSLNDMEEYEESIKQEEIKAANSEKVSSEEKTEEQADVAGTDLDLKQLLAGATFVSTNSANEISDPDTTPRARINPEAPAPFIGMAAAYQQGNVALATRYAGQYVRYMVNLMYEVTELSRLVAEALVREKMVNEEEIAGVGQFVDIESARARTENSYVVRPTHDLAMKRIKPDPKNEVFIYYLFSLSCRYCSEMSPDVERLWQIAKSDKRIKMVGMTLGETSPEWIRHYREYTGLSMPIIDGTGLANLFRIRFLPALIVISPNTNTSYLKTGQVSFLRMYEMMRTTQGLSTEPTPEVLRLANQSVGFSKVVNVTATNRAVRGEKTVDSVRGSKKEKMRAEPVKVEKTQILELGRL